VGDEVAGATEGVAADGVLEVLGVPELCTGADVLAMVAGPLTTGAELLATNARGVPAVEDADVPVNAPTTAAAAAAVVTTATRARRRRC